MRPQQRKSAYEIRGGPFAAQAAISRGRVRQLLPTNSGHEIRADRVTGFGAERSRRRRPAHVAEQVRGERRRQTRRWRRVGASRRADRDPHSCSRGHGRPARLRDRVCPPAAAHGGAGDVEIVTSSRRRRSRSVAPLRGLSALAVACVPANAGLDQAGATGGGDHVGGVRAIRANVDATEHERALVSARVGGLSW